MAARQAEAVPPDKMVKRTTLKIPRPNERLFCPQKKTRHKRGLRFRQGVVQRICEKKFYLEQSVFDKTSVTAGYKLYASKIAGVPNASDSQITFVVKYPTIIFNLRWLD